MPLSSSSAHVRPTSYRVAAGEAQSEVVIKNSVFIGTLGQAEDVAQAQAYIARVRERYADANHNAWAYRISAGPQGLIGSSDDGEPGGTAGRPMLAILEGSGICQVVAVVTRYFGGVKLGTGGLVRAYGGAVREALPMLPTRELVLHYQARFAVDYALYGNLRYLLPRQGVKIVAEAFAADVTLDLALPHDRLDALAEQLRELTNGQVRLNDSIIGDSYEESLATP